MTKVHREAELHHRRGRTIVLIGHKGHPEVVGTMGQLPDGAVLLVETVEDVGAPGRRPIRRTSPGRRRRRCRSTTRTAIVDALTRRFPAIVGPHKDDICYATTNRQEAVKAVAPKVDAMIVVGAPNSSNSQRLREVADAIRLPAGAPRAARG